MEGTGILDDIINYNKTKSKYATHFVLCNGEKIRYFISLNKGKKYLIKNISTYSNKLTMLMKLIKFLPFTLMQKFRLGYFVEAKICEEVQDVINSTMKSKTCWNIIVGTYDLKQKLVIQAWDDSNKRSLYYKVGNSFSDKEMIREIEFLSSNYKYKKFKTPNIIYNRKISEGYKFNIQVTEEFNGNKVKQVLTEDIYSIFKELVHSRDIQIIDGILHGFSHGDFAPWNLKVTDNNYILFDWEHCGIRFYGFDLIHYIYQIETLLNGKDSEDAFEIAFNYFKNKCKKYTYNEVYLKKMYFDEYYKIHYKN